LRLIQRQFSFLFRGLHASIAQSHPLRPFPGAALHISIF
jgi:hypothetical protein